MMLSWFRNRKRGALPAPYSWSAGDAPDQKAQRELDEFRIKSLPKVTALTAINQRCIDMQKTGIEPETILISPEDSRELAFQSAVQTWRPGQPIPMTFDEPQVVTYVATLQAICQHNTYRSFIESKSGVRFDISFDKTDPAKRRAILREIEERELKIADIRRQIEQTAEEAARQIIAGQG